MSRSRYWDYELGDVDAWHRFFTDVRAYGVPPKYVPTGGANLGTGEANIVFYANAAKARRLKVKLDAAFGVEGVLHAFQL